MEKNFIFQFKRNHLNYKIPPFTIQKHIDGPICLRAELIPHSRETDLVSGGKSVNFIKPKTDEEVADRNMLPYYHTSFRNIYKANQNRNFNQRQKKTQLKQEKDIKDLAPTTCNRKLSLRIWGQTLIFIKLNLKVNGCVIILLSSFICLCFHKDIEPFIMSRDCKSGILSPQVPKELLKKGKR